MKMQLLPIAIGAWLELFVIPKGAAFCLGILALSVLIDALTGLVATIKNRTKYRQHKQASAKQNTNDKSEKDEHRIHHQTVAHRAQTRRQQRRHKASLVPAGIELE